MMRQFIDNYEHIDGSVEYVLENILQTFDGSKDFKALEADFYSHLNNGCGCSDDCTSSCVHGNNYRMNENQLLLKDDRTCLDLIYECNESCKCDYNCTNRLVQFGPCDGLLIRNFGAKGLGLITQKFLPKGSFICEYAGEILTKSEAARREKENQRFDKMNYIFCLNEIKLGSDEKIQTFFDPSEKGNIGRYLNHSCNPNCFIISVRSNSFIPKLAIFSLRDINPLEELTFSYGEFVESESKKPCHCQSQNCKKFLPNLTF